jgi:multidrug efflux pump
MMGAFFREFTVTLVAAIVVSAIVSLTLTPALCSRFLSIRRRPNRPPRFAGAGRGHERCWASTPWLDLSLRHALLPADAAAADRGTVFLIGAVGKGASRSRTPADLGRASSSAPCPSPTCRRASAASPTCDEGPGRQGVGVRLGSGRQGARLSSTSSSSPPKAGAKPPRMSRRD